MEKQPESPREEKSRRKNLSRRAKKLNGYLALEAFDRLFYGPGIKYLAGVDEAGRGALAGPVVAGAVILRPFPALIGVRDSKKLSEKMREELFDQIIEKSLAVGISIRSPEVIDKHNILKAALAAMAEAVGNLRIKPDAVIVDGNQVIKCEGRVLAIPGGDDKSLAIGAASILAKVARDRVMRKLHRKYPEYNFMRNKGYGTREHVDAICRYGIGQQHRKTFKLKRIEKSPGMS